MQVYNFIPMLQMVFSAIHLQAIRPPSGQQVEVRDSCAYLGAGYFFITKVHSRLCSSGYSKTTMPLNTLLGASYQRTVIWNHVCQPTVWCSNIGLKPLYLQVDTLEHLLVMIHSKSLYPHEIIQAKLGTAPMMGQALFQIVNLINQIWIMPPRRIKNYIHTSFKASWKCQQHTEKDPHSSLSSLSPLCVCVCVCVCVWRIWRYAMRTYLQTNHLLITCIR